LEDPEAELLPRDTTSEASNERADALARTNVLSVRVKDQQVRTISDDLRVKSTDVDGAANIEEGLTEFSATMDAFQALNARIGELLRDTY